MPYSAEISRANPSCFLFLIDQSGSMEDPFGGGEATRKKADLVADAINRLLQNLVIKCAKEEGIRDYQDCVRCHRSADEEPNEGGDRRERSGGREHDDDD